MGTGISWFRLVHADEGQGHVDSVVPELVGPSPRMDRL